MAGLYNREAGSAPEVRVGAGGIIPDVVGEGLVARYPFMLSLGVAAGLLWHMLASRAPATSGVPQAGYPPPAKGINASLVALAGGLLGARLAFVLVHSGYYLVHPVEALAIWQGGLAWHGAAAGVVLGLLVYSRLAITPFWAMIDTLAVPVTWVAAAAWIGCLLDGCAYGARMEDVWWAIPAPDWIGVVAPRWPTQLAGSALCLVSVVLLTRFEELRLWPGASGCLSLALIAAISTGLSLTRGDPIWLVLGVRLDTLASIVILLPSLGVLAWQAYRDRLGRHRCLASP